MIYENCFQASIDTNTDLDPNLSQDIEIKVCLVVPILQNPKK